MRARFLWCVAPLLLTACAGEAPAPNDDRATDSARADASASGAAGASGAPASGAPASGAPGDARDTTPPRTPADSAEQARVDSVLAAIAACPRDGRWHPCSLEHRLQLAGLRPARLDSVTGPDGTIPGLAVPTTVWRTGQRTVRVAFFPDSAAARTAFAGLDSAAAGPRGAPLPAWPEPPTLFRGANAIVLMLGGTSRQVERLVDAIQAGPPQPK